MRNLLSRLLLTGLVAGLSAPVALAANGPNLVTQVYLDDAEVPVGTSTRFDIEVCNDGNRSATNTYLSTLLPSGIGYSIAMQPRGGSCRAVRYGSQVYLYCMVTVRPTACVDFVLNVYAATPGDYTLTGVADGNNLLRETNETDNSAAIVLTAY